MIHITLVRTDIDDRLLAQLETMLTSAEQARAARFRRMADRRRHVVARVALKTLLADRLQCDAQDVQLDAGPFGKPTLAAAMTAMLGGAPAEAPLHFNLSHSGDLALIALAPVPVGIDLERDTPADAQALAQAWFTPAEQTRLTQGQTDFLGLWTAREAVLKAMGTGLSADPMAFAVPPADPRLPTFQPGYAPAANGDAFTVPPTTDASPVAFRSVHALSGDPSFAGCLVAPLALTGVPGIPPSLTAPYRAAVAVRGAALPVSLNTLDATDLAARVTLRAIARASDAPCPAH